MCIDPATMALISSGVSAGLGVVQYAQSRADARGVEAAADQQASAELQRGIFDQEQYTRQEQYAQGEEVNQISASGVSGAYGSPFLIALENAGNFGMNRANIGRDAAQRAGAIQTQGGNSAGQIRSQGFGGLVQGAAGAIDGYRTAQRARNNSIFLGGHSLPGV